MTAPFLLTRRTSIAAAVVVPVVWVDWKLYGVLSSGGVSLLDGLVLLLFSLCIVHLLFSFALAVAGFIVSLLNLDPISLTRAGTAKTALPKLTQTTAPIASARVAIAIPVYKESLREVVERLSTLYRDLDTMGKLSQFDFFLLSDSPQQLEAEEEEVWRKAVSLLNAEARLFYRRRIANTKKKLGNIHDFLERWGRSFKYFCVLDADSTMTGESVLAMYQLMEADDALGAVQTVPFSIRGGTVFSRMLEWNSLWYSRLFSVGFSFWQGDEANYYGHNALIRTDAFQEHCVLPDMPGKPPFGGTILSHDFVESALLVKAGYKVLMLPHVPGSYEEIPNSLIDFLLRDKRWMQGNLQHIRVAARLPMKLFSRFQLCYGAYCYLASLLWFLFLAVATVKTLFYQKTHYYFPHRYQLFPEWPVSQALVTLALYVLTLGLILMPKCMGLIERAVCSGIDVHRLGLKRSVLAIASAFIEFVCSAFLAPIVMMYHVRFLWGFLIGTAVTWDPQQRGVESKPLSLYIKEYGWVACVGIAWLGLVVWQKSPLVWWIVPVLVPMALSPLFVWVLEHPRALRVMQRLGILAVREVPHHRLDW
jgi:membrane glycosyltransferase